MLTYLLGSCCVLWTVVELSKLLRRSRQAQAERLFQAWDQSGRQLPVDKVH